MALATRVIGEGGVIGEFVASTVAYPDDSQPTLAYTEIIYRMSQAPDASVNYVWDTTWTPADIRSRAKDAIKADILLKTGLTTPKSAIKMMNSPE